MDTSKTRSLHILVIDDHEVLARAYCTLFDLLGHSAVVACSGIEGIQMASADKPDVIFCDIGLPGMTGYQVAEQIRSDELLKDVYLVALTGYAGSKTIELAKKAGFNLHLQKPANLEILQKVLDDIPTR